MNNLEKQQVSIGTVAKWAMSLIAATSVITGALFKLDALEKSSDQLEARVHNLEENVLWRQQ